MFPNSGLHCIGMNELYLDGVMYVETEPTPFRKIQLAHHFKKYFDLLIISTVTSALLQPQTAWRKDIQYSGALSSRTMNFVFPAIYNNPIDYIIQRSVISQ